MINAILTLITENFFTIIGSLISVISAASAANSAYNNRILLIHHDRIEFLKQFQSSHDRAYTGSASIKEMMLFRENLCHAGFYFSDETYKCFKNYGEILVSFYMVCSNVESNQSVGISSDVASKKRGDISIELNNAYEITFNKSMTEVHEIIQMGFMVKMWKRIILEITQCFKNLVKLFFGG